MRILTDDDVRSLGPKDAVETMRTTLLAHAREQFYSPPRSATMVGSMRLIFGAGGESAGAMGLRIASAANAPLEQLTVTWTSTGEVDAIITGKEIGARRTGSVAAVAADLLAAPGPLRVGILGSGRNGWGQIWGLTGVRTITELAVFSPNPEHRSDFAARARTELEIDARAVSTAEEAVLDMDVVILCTTSTTPVIESAWVRDGAHVTSIGPKTTTSHETPDALIGRVRQVVSDAPNELSAPVSELASRPLVALGSLLLEGTRERRADEVSLFLYSGLGGMDAAYGLAVARMAKGNGEAIR